MINNISFNIYSELEQNLAATISDRATDEVLEALTRYQRGMGIIDTQPINEHSTPDIVRSRSSQVNNSN